MHRIFGVPALLVLFPLVFGVPLVAVMVAMARKFRADIQSGNRRAKSYGSLSMKFAVVSAMCLIHAARTEIWLPSLRLGLFAGAFPVIIWTNQWIARPK